MGKKSNARWKRVNSLILTVCMIISMLPTMAFAAVDEEFTDVNGLRYKVLTEDAGNNTGTVALTGYVAEPMGELTVAESVYSTSGGAITYTVTEIGEGAFEFCDEITEVVIPNSVEIIGEGAFNYSNGITSVSISASVTSIGNEAFAQCGSLTAFTVAAENGSFSADDGILYNRDKSTLIQYPPGKSFEDFAFPDTVKTIGSYAFAFMGGTLKTLIIGDSIETIGDNAFYNCRQLSEVTIGSGVKSIGKRAFRQCYNLGKVNFASNSSLETIGAGAFEDGIFTEFSIPDSVTNIGEGALGYCNNLTSISISENVVTLGDKPFYVNHALESIDVDEGNKNYSSKNGVLYNKSGDTLLRYPANKVDTKFIIPSGVITLAESSFYDANNKLEKLIIPSTVSEIEKGTFYWAKALQDIRFLGEIPPTVEEGDTFGRTDSLSNIYVPRASVEAYKSALSPALAEVSKSIEIIQAYAIPDATEVITAEELQAALANTTKQTIWVTKDINMEDASQPIEIGADHDLIIDSGKTVSTGEIELTIPEDITLAIDGTLKLTAGSKFEVKGSIYGKNGGKVILEKGAKLYNVDFLFNDRGENLLYEDEIIVEDGSALPSLNTLTAGEYIWDGEAFKKEGNFNWDEVYDLVIAGVKVGESNASKITGAGIVGQVSYDVDSKTLTLNNAEIATNGAYKYDYAIYSGNDKDIKMELRGKSTIGNSKGFEISDYNVSYGISANGNIELVGSGDLNIYDQVMGINGKDITVNSTGNITIVEKGGGKVCCFKAEGGTLTINRGNLKLFSTESNGLYGDSAIVINGGTITAQSEMGTAFNMAPTFGSNYSYTVKVGSSEDDAKETTNPTFTEKYIRIEPKTSGGGSSGGGSTTQPTVQPTIPSSDGSVEVEYTTSNGVATLSINNTKVNEIIAKAKAGEVVFDLQAIKGTNSVKITNNALSSFEKAQLGTAIKLSEGTALIDNKALASILKQSTGTADMKLELKEVPTSNLSEAQKQAINSGDLVFDINILMDTKNITEFDGTLTIELPYEGELPVAVWYLNDKGELEKIEASYKNGVVSFALNHLSLYVVGKDETVTEDKWVNPFIDVKEDSWFYEVVKYVYENDLMKGTGDNTFSPDGITTRGMIVTILHRLEGKPVAGANPFGDVAGGKYYAEAVAWAAGNNIVNGYGNDKFGPEDAITREQLTAILMNYAKKKGYDVSSKADLSKYEDTQDISSWAKDAVAWANGAGLIQGDGNSLMPTGNATRSQVAAILNRFVEKTAK